MGRMSCHIMWSECTATCFSAFSHVAFVPCRPFSAFAFSECFLVIVLLWILFKTAIELNVSSWPFFIPRIISCYPLWAVASPSFHRVERRLIATRTLKCNTSVRTQVPSSLQCSLATTTACIFGSCVYS